MIYANQLSRRARLRVAFFLLKNIVKVIARWTWNADAGGGLIVYRGGNACFWYESTAKVGEAPLHTGGVGPVF